MIPTVVSVLLLFGALISDLPYGYYTVLRWVVSLTCVYRAFLGPPNRQGRWMYVFLLMAILFNPLIPVTMPRESWLIFDVGGALVLLFSFGQFKRIVEWEKRGS